MLNATRVLGVGALLFSQVVSGRIITANSSNFVSALKSASGGDQINLTGNIGFLKLSGINYSSRVTIDASAAHFNDTIVISDSSNLMFKGGVFGSDTRNSSWGRDVQVYGGRNIGFDQAQFVGPNNGGGVNFSSTNGAYILNSSFTNLATGGAFYDVTNGTISNNVIYGQRKDGFDLAASHVITASHNSCLGASPLSGAHPDCIQIWSTAGKPLSSDIQIMDNLSYGASQGFTKFGSGGGGTRISILRNIVESTMPQGIACYGCTDSTIADNFLAGMKSAPHWVNLNVIGGSNDVVSNNSMQRLSTDSFIAPPTGFAASLAGLLANGQHAAIPSLASTNVTAQAASEVVASVPEPTIWASLIIGFGLHGSAMRLRRRGRVLRGVSS